MGLPTDAVLTALRASFPAQKFIIQSVTRPGDVPSDTFWPTRYGFDRMLAASPVGAKAQGVATHIYYGGYPPEWANDLASGVAVKYGLGVYVTEYGFWFLGAPKDHTNGPLATRGRGAIEAADYLLYLIENPQIAGAVIHGIGGGDWNLIRADGTPSQVMIALKLWRDALLDDVVAVSPRRTMINTAHSTFGQHLVAMQSTDGKRSNLLGVNRDSAWCSLKIKWPGLAVDANHAVRIRMIRNLTDLADGIMRDETLANIASKTDSAGNLCIDIPPLTLFTIEQLI